MLTEKIRLEVDCTIEPVSQNMNFRFVTTNLIRQGQKEELFINVSASNHYVIEDSNTATAVTGRATSELARRYLGNPLKEIWDKLHVDDPLYNYLEKWMYASDGISMNPTSYTGFANYLNEFNSNLEWTDVKLRYFDADDIVECIRKIRQFIDDNRNKRLH